ncbi:thiazole synthase [Candidatus Soleaferrea massiliensis]|uniref:thiazole synthase n=1 Tax=Candidatus Soleaferrea massiliensis TaxID=1470354 RepID=UPI00058B6C88|nr:thiazole synthase [Candidatus Soleaferrea massiliensis]
MADTLKLGGKAFTSRLFLGTGKFPLNLMEPVLRAAGTQVVTLALRRANVGGEGNILDCIPDGITLMPNTSGARNAEEAVRIARLSRELGCGNWIKIEVVPDSKYLMPDNVETIKATEILVKEGFTVLPYMNPDLVSARQLAEAGAAAVMPLGAPIGSNKGLSTREHIRMLIDEIDLPIVVDAGIGKPSQACEAMELGAAAVLVNTAVASAGDPVMMAEAFKNAVEAGRAAFLAGAGRVLGYEGEASSPLTGFLGV